MRTQQQHRLISLHAPARLHLGFLDPAGTLGRRFGSLGLVIDGIETEIELAAAPSEDEWLAADATAESELPRAARYLAQLREHTGCLAPLRIELKRVLPPHAGFGSGTQLALALGHAFARFHRLELSSLTLAHWLARGLRSGIGIAGFDQGGLLVDGGPGADGRPAPLLSRIAFPEAWRVLVVQDARVRGLSGAQEKAAIAALPPFPESLSADICHQVLMRVLPGAASGEFEAFAAGVNRIQQLLGDHFAPAQGGSAYTSPAVEQAMQWLGEADAAIGQSSWGPTGFAIVPTPGLAEALAQGLAGRLPPGLSVRVVRGLNRGARIADSTRLASAA
ncbi:beta-ribofuranosylaminobenzene 5'-phosphate synthase family protein [Pelomonas sp. KK5]|uniref:beta-ribofuranosylaminobenzene 5'-phosphate synthase family protein n=1 Tax=Pelomonas sp. KK5 TaxID=1855730 RepID=UPI00097C3164|nr:beta-ribofuranosylaminobenzene 5'-phosphate synthase family protein [Pelomonas sp. KK5]